MGKNGRGTFQGRGVILIKKNYYNLNYFKVIKATSLSWPLGNERALMRQSIFHKKTLRMSESATCRIIHICCLIEISIWGLNFDGITEILTE